MAHVQGIAIVEEVPLPTAIIEGTGIEVFEVMKVYYAVDGDWNEFRETFGWLSEDQLRAALRYAEAEAEALRRRLAAEDEAAARIELLWKEYPSTAPKRS